MPRPLLAVLGPLVVALAVPASAPARDALVAGGGALTFVNVTTNAVSGRVVVGGATSAVAAAPDGARGYVASGRRVVTVDLAGRTVAASTTLTGAPLALATTPNGSRLLAGRRGAVDVLGTIPAPTRLATIALGAGAAPRAIAVAPDGLRALVLLDRRRVAILDLTSLTVARRVRLTGAGGVAISSSG
ncbi:MAG TPA: hypothetical protein VII98_14285, partial [Solirubrobacteraceae bacterium]